MPRGRKPTPTALKLLKGNPGRRPPNPSEPKPAADRPRCPQHLDTEARKEWRRIVPELEQLGLLTILDRAALALYCQAWSRWVRASREIDENGEILESKNGKPVQSPWISLRNRAGQDMHKFLAEFGMTPSSRTRVTATRKPLDQSNPFGRNKR